ncbi:MAG TPA: hypothetical protein VI233_06885 [Puia sp.]
MKRHHIGLLFALIASVVLSSFYTPYYNPVSGDKEIYRYIGRVMARGRVVYKDVFDHKPPLIHFFSYLVILRGGDWAQWVLDAGLALLATVLFYRLGRKYKLPYPWMLPVLFNLMLRDNFLCLGMGMTRTYSSMLLLIFYCVLLSESKFRYYLLGLITGLQFFLQQDQVCPLVPFFIYAFWPDEDKIPVLTRILRTAAGFAVIAVPIILYFALNGALMLFIQDAFLFNFSWYTTTLKESFADHLKKIKKLIDEGDYEVPVLVAITLGLFALGLKSRRKRLLMASFAAVFLSLIQEFMGGRDITPQWNGMGFTHYILPLAATIPMLLFSIFAFSEDPIFQGKKVAAVYGILMLTSLSYAALRYSTQKVARNSDPAVAGPEIDYLRQHRPIGDYKLYVFGHNDFVYAYNDLGIIGPTHWVYQHFYQLYDHWDADLSELHGICDDLLKHQTTYVLDFTKPTGWFRNPKAYDVWHGFLVEHYEEVDLTGSKNSFGVTGKVWKFKWTP